MATKSIIVSDVSGKELADDQHARIIVSHPDYRNPLEIDVSVDEAAKLNDTTLRLVEFTIYEPGKPARKATVETKVLDKLFPKFDDVLQGARKAEQTVGQKVAARRSSAPKGERIDYTLPNTFGQLHRGRVTDAEKELVKANREQASKNREAQTGKPIDWNDAAEVKRYGL